LARMKRAKGKTFPFFPRMTRTLTLVYFDYFNPWLE
jgi:hypothetical protein